MSFYKSTYYQVLGLQPGVSSLEIKQAYRRLAKSYHPDVDRSKWTTDQKSEAHQIMARLNEAYETLKDKSKRAAYDSLIGVNGRGSQTTDIFSDDTEQKRQYYLNQIFHPARQKVSRILSQYKTQLNNLSQDIYDQNLVAELENYGNRIESALSTASHAMNNHKAPPSLSAAELMLRLAMVHAVDGLEELRYFFSNYNYDHLMTAGSLFRESNKLSRQAFSLCKS